MKKDNQKKESLKLDVTEVSGRIFSVPNPIPSWMEVFFKPQAAYVLPNINENIIEGYPIDDDF